MPYNNTAILPSEDVTGAAILPLARVKKIINADDEIGAVSNQAAFIATKATELFVRYLAEKAFATGKVENKPKRSLQYRDIAQIVSRTDNLEFLNDLVPQTTTFRAHKEKRSREAASQTAKRARSGGALASGQTTLDGPPPPPTCAPTLMTLTANGNGHGHGHGQGLEFRHYEPVATTTTSAAVAVAVAVAVATATEKGDRDVEMG